MSSGSIVIMSSKSSLCVSCSSSAEPSIGAHGSCVSPHAFARTTRLGVLHETRRDDDATGTCETRTVPCAALLVPRTPVKRFKDAAIGTAFSRRGTARRPGTAATRETLQIIAERDIFPRKA
mmetsp:Transcript_11467/g.37920  ORF Transcript_11467/g.37920 Transcript_11467/m.37920 type:complete len:122 (-) Transcript_11467:156-521(-)